LGTAYASLWRRIASEQDWDWIRHYRTRASDWQTGNWLWHEMTELFSDLGAARMRLRIMDVVFDGVTGEFYYPGMTDDLAVCGHHVVEVLSQYFDLTFNGGHPASFDILELDFSQQIRPALHRAA
jgi:hypothetical protein